MTEIDKKNSQIIEEIVEKHFDLEKDSLSLFKDRLHSPVVDPFYKEVFKNSPDLRIKFKISEDKFENFDKGWPLFYKLFPEFCRVTNISYSDYRSNKLSFKGKTLKLKKAIFDFYTHDATACRRFLGSMIDLKNEEHLKCLDGQITDYLNRVGVLKLPSSGVEIVLTMNFADWFLAATAEKWRSCINLESDFSGSYWTGLPGLLGDPNRSMLYISDGNKKNYRGIKVDSCISRSWVELDEGDRLNLVRFFPNDMIDAETIADATRLPFRFGRDYRSKHPLDIMYFGNKRSCFIYTDNSKITKLTGGKIFLMHDSGGRYSYVDKETGAIVNGVNIFNYKDGLGKLVEKAKTIGDIFNNTCSSCGNYREHFHNFQGRILCNDCFARYVITCDHCGIQILADGENFKSIGNKRFCLTCYNKLYTRCSSCNKIEAKTKMLHFIENDEWYCSSCAAELEEKFVSCTKCHVSYFKEPDGYFHYINDDVILCEKCFRKEDDKYQLFLDLALAC